MEDEDINTEYEQDSIDYEDEDYDYSQILGAVYEIPHG